MLCTNILYPTITRLEYTRSAYSAASAWQYEAPLSVEYLSILISKQYHPISDLPAFFIHPCNTAEALQEVGLHEDVGPEEYLLLWLGLIGTGMNLHVPSNLLLE